MHRPHELHAPNMMTGVAGSVGGCSRNYPTIMVPMPGSPPPMAANPNGAQPIEVFPDPVCHTDTCHNLPGHLVPGYWGGGCINGPGAPAPTANGFLTRDDIQQWADANPETTNRWRAAAHAAETLQQQFPQQITACGIGSRGPGSLVLHVQYQGNGATIPTQWRGFPVEATGSHTTAGPSGRSGCAELTVPTDAWPWTGQLLKQFGFHPSRYIAFSDGPGSVSARVLPEEGNLQAVQDALTAQGIQWTTVRGRVPCERPAGATQPGLDDAFAFIMNPDNHTRTAGGYPQQTVGCVAAPAVAQDVEVQQAGEQLRRWVTQMMPGAVVSAVWRGSIPVLQVNTAKMVAQAQCGPPPTKVGRFDVIYSR